MKNPREDIPWGKDPCPKSHLRRRESMTTDPANSLSPNPEQSLPEQIADALAGGLGDCNLRELLGLVLNSLGQAERRKYLAHTPADKGNGSYPRSINMGSIPL